MKFRIREAVAEDREKIRPLQKQIADLHRDGRPDLFKEEVRYFDEDSFNWRINEPTHFVLIAEGENGEALGYAFAWIRYIRDHSTYLDRNELYIDDVCVLEKHQRQGIGRMIFDTLKEKAKENGCKTMELGVFSFNKNAIAFYESVGMTERIKRMEMVL